MSASELTLDAAWRALCSARQQPGTRGPGTPGAGVTFAPDGTWRSPGGVSEDARALLDCLAPLAAPTERLVIAQLGQSLDGRIATESGQSHYINGFDSRVHLHRLRALVDAVVVGAGAAAEDNPRLTVRHVTGPQPARVILDPRGRVPAATHLLQCDAARTFHLVGDDIGMHPNVSGHVHRLVLPRRGDGGFAPTAVLEALARHGTTRVLIEGGGITVSRFLEAGVLDRLHLLVAPLLVGSGRPGLQMTPIATLEQALRPGVRRFFLGEDTLFDLDLLRGRR